MMKIVSLALIGVLLCLATAAHDCKENAYWEPEWDKCMCNKGYEMNDYGDCVHPHKQPRCPPNSHYEAWQDKCVCWNGFKMEGKYCVPVKPDPKPHQPY